MSDPVDKVLRNLYAAVVWFGVGFAAAGYLRPATPVTGPVPPPITAPIAAAKHTGHFTVSYIEPLYGTPASAAVRDALAGVDWAKLDATFRSYTDGQDELRDLGFTAHFSSADLPVLFIQETGPTGAPIIPPPLKAPASAAAVVARVKELRGQ